MSEPGDSPILTGEVSDEERHWALVAHLGGLIAMALSASAMGFLVPLIVWQIKKDQSRFVADQAKEALNFQLSLLIATLVLVAGGSVLTLLTCGFGIIPIAVAGVALLVYAAVASILAATQAASGKMYRYPVTLRLVS